LGKRRLGRKEESLLAQRGHDVNVKRVFHHDNNQVDGLKRKNTAAKYFDIKINRLLKRKKIFAAKMVLIFA